MRDIVTKIKTYMTKGYNQKGTYAWYNTYRMLKDNEIVQLDNYVHSHNFIKKMIIVNNIEITRPQRTWGGMPEFFRPDSPSHYFQGGNNDNTFIFAIFENLEVSDDEIAEAVKSFPNIAKIIIIGKEE